MVSQTKGKISQNLYHFIKEILIENKKEFKTFVDFWHFLIEIYPSFKGKIFSNEYINFYKKKLEKEQQTPNIKQIE